jgi:replicative DNA helicase
LHTRELVTVAGAPGAGKSVFATNFALRADFPVLYVAQDSAPSVLARLAALELGWEISEAFNAIREPDTRTEVIQSIEERVRPELVVQTGRQSVNELELRIKALTEWLGEAPPLVIIDNLIDMRVDGKDHTEQGFYAEALNGLKEVALQHNTCVMALHHVTRRGAGDSAKEAHGLGTRPLKMTDLWYSGERESEHVIGIYHSSTMHKLHIQLLKQRDGEADPNGGVTVTLPWSPRMGRMGNR